MPTQLSLAEKIDDVLPQTQCAQCGHHGCRPYAVAIAGGEAPINRCAPGGARGIALLAALTESAILPLDPAYGVEAPLVSALIDESHCIGCTLCIDACPVDAIVGAARSMHTVLADRCTGCKLCIAPCPVDCIELVSAGFEWDDRRRETARANHVATSARRALAARRRRDVKEGLTRAATASGDRTGITDPATRHAAIEAALERARRRRLKHGRGQS